MGLKTAGETPEDRVQTWFDRVKIEDYNVHTTYTYPPTHGLTVLICEKFHDASVFKVLKLEEVTIAPTGEATTVYSFVVPRELCR